MPWYLEAALYGGVYALGAWSWPKVRLALMGFYEHPIITIEADIAKLKALLAKHRGAP